MLRRIAPWTKALAVLVLAAPLLASPERNAIGGGFTHRSFSEGGQGGLYYPPAGAWTRKSAAELGLDGAKLAEAVAYAESHETTRAIDFSDQEPTFGTMLGSLPTKRAKTNGLVIYKGYVAAEFGDTTWVDPTYSVAKSMMSTVAAVAMRSATRSWIRSADRTRGSGCRTTTATS